MTEPRNPDLVALLEQLEQDRADQGMPIGARNRVQLAIGRHEARQRARWRRWLPAASFAAGAALVLSVVGARWLQPAAEVGVAAPELAAPVVASAATPSPPGLASFAVEGPDPGCASPRRNGAATLAAHCRLVSPQMAMQAWEPATVRSGAEGVRVEGGKVLFEVETVPPGDDPVQVAVSHGTIEVVGTRFAVEQGVQGGHVDLLEGKIRFHHHDGRVEDVLPGQRLSWGSTANPQPPASVEVRPEPPAAAEEPHSPRKGRARSANARAAAVIERVTELRAERRYGAAISELRRALRRKWDRRTAQVLSYELGDLLRVAEDTVGACEHFAAHQRKYPQGRYATAVDRVVRRLDCGAP
jgi:hypothetical protein